MPHLIKNFHFPTSIPQTKTKIFNLRPSLAFQGKFFPMHQSNLTSSCVHVCLQLNAPAWGPCARIHLPSSHLCLLKCYLQGQIHLSHDGFLWPTFLLFECSSDALGTSLLVLPTFCCTVLVSVSLYHSFH